MIKNLKHNLKTLLIITVINQKICNNKSNQENGPANITTKTKFTLIIQKNKDSVKSVKSTSIFKFIKLNSKTSKIV